MMLACSFLATQNPRRRSFAISIYVCYTLPLRLASPRERLLAPRRHARVFSLAHAARWVCRGVRARASVSYVSAACWHNTGNITSTICTGHRRRVSVAATTLRNVNNVNVGTHLALESTRSRHELYDATTTCLRTSLTLVVRSLLRRVVPEMLLQRPGTKGTI